MRNIALACGILAGVVSVGMCAMSNEEWDRAVHSCIKEHESGACQALINDGLKSVEQCDDKSCMSAGGVYFFARRYKEAIPYYEKAIALGDNTGYAALGGVYIMLQDYHNAKKHYEIGCEKSQCSSSICLRRSRTNVL